MNENIGLTREQELRIERDKQIWNEAIDSAINYISETRETDISLEDMEKLKR